MTKICDLEIVGEKCYYRLYGCSNVEMLDIINYKSWEFKSWKYGREKKYFSFIYSNRGSEMVVWSYLGFAPILIRYLQGLGYIVNGKELFRAKEIILGKTYYEPWDFQLNAIDTWINNGCYGVIKMPTGCLTGDSIIYTNKGLITIKELFDKRYEDVKVMNYKGNEIQYNEIDNYYHYKDKDILKITTKFGYELKCTPEHKVVCIGDNGLLEFKQAKDLKIGSVIPISYGSNNFGDVEYNIIESIEKMGNEDVYDLTIKNIPHYIANGFIVHNSGKTFSTCKIIEKMKLRTIICVHTSDLLINAWYGELIKQFSEGIKNRIGIIGGGLTKKDRLEMRLSGDTSYEYNIKKDIVIATSQSLLNKLDKLVNERFGLMVIDEAHHYPSEQFKKVTNAIRAPYRLGLSATLIRPDGMSPLIHGLIGDIVYRVSIKELVRKGFLVEPIFETIVIDDTKTQDEINGCGLSKLELSRYIKNKSASSVVKKDYIIELMVNLIRNGKKVIMYTDFVNRTDKNNKVFTRDDYVRELNELGLRVVGVSSDMSGEEREVVFKALKDNKVDGLVFGKLGAEGVNIPNIDSIIMCNTTKSTILFPQRCGRSMRITDNNKKNSFIYEICLNLDKELEWSKTNFYEYASEGYIKKFVNI